MYKRQVPVVGEWCRAAAREPAASITTVSSPWGVWWMVRVSSSVFLAHRDGAESERSLARLTRLLASRAVPVVGEWCRAAAREPAAPITTVSSPWGV